MCPQDYRCNVGGLVAWLHLRSNLSHAYVDTKNAETNPTEAEVIGTLASDEALMLEDNPEPSALDIALAKVSGHNLQLHLSVM